jgi:hypothetical protein
MPNQHRDFRLTESSSPAPPQPLVLKHVADSIPVKSTEKSLQLRLHISLKRSSLPPDLFAAFPCGQLITPIIIWNIRNTPASRHRFEPDLLVCIMVEGIG